MEEAIKELLKRAYHGRVDDIHFLPDQDHYAIYFRQGGNLVHQRDLNLEEGARWIRYLKYVSHLDVGERRLPQEGSLFYDLDDFKIELRLSTLANYMLQESLVIRLLFDYEQETLSIESLDDFEIMKTYMKKQSGLILFSGPVSSGKTTLIYQLLRDLYQKQPKQIITMEDPVELKEKNFLQVQVNEKAGTTYDVLIKASLRHHPDILLIGEIRDEWTARMVMRAALTGNLVLATVHAKNCVGVLGRLQELGISQEQLLQTLLLIVSQRLIPLLPLEDNRRSMICEWMDASMITHWMMNGQHNDQFSSLNKKLEEAYQGGRISQEVKASYQLESDC